MRKAIIQYLEQLRYSGIREIYISKPEQTAETQSGLRTEDKIQLLRDRQQAYQNCRNCPLWEGRNKFVYGEGNPDAVCMVIGEGPGANENLQGRPFVGEAGQLLDKMLIAINIERKDVYIANIVKCRPPGNRNPEQAEREACLPYLLEQIEIIQPKMFLLMGLVAAQTLLQTNQAMKVLREGAHSFLNRPAYVTYHPAALLRNPNWKRDAWTDLKKFRIDYEAELAKLPPKQDKDNAQA
jgi:DNA polymerase